MSDNIPITEAGKARLTEELKQLKSVERPMIVREIEVARDHGDLSENAEYKYAKEKQSHIEGRIQQLEDWLARAEVIDVSQLSGDRIVFGARVRLQDQETEREVSYRIVGEYEADLKKGLISITSPIARSLIGKHVGDEVQVNAPGGIREYEILEVSYAQEAVAEGA